MKEKLNNKVSPPFEGGVVGTIEYQLYNKFYFPTGVVDSLISSKTSLSGKIQKSSDHHFEIFSKKSSQV